MNGYDNDFSDIDRWQKDYRPTPAQRPGPEALPQGAYDFQIVAAELAKVGNPPETIFRLALCVIGGSHDGLVIDRPTFFRRQESLDYLGGDLMSLGVTEASSWGKGDQPISQLLRDACQRVVGLRCRGVRKDGKPQNGKPGFPNLYITGLLADSPMPPGAGAGVGDDCPF